MNLVEDYCSKEVRNLLVTKGFVGDIWYNNDDLYISHALAMKWLREAHNIIIVIDYNEEEDVEENERYGFSIYQNNVRKVDLATYVTYEGAVEAALKYALENLI